MCVVVCLYLVFLSISLSQQQELLMKLLQQAPRQGSSGSGSSWNGGPIPGLGKQNKSLNLLEAQQEAERMHKQQHRVQQQQRVGHTNDKYTIMAMWNTILSAV